MLQRLLPLLLAPAAALVLAVPAASSAAAPAAPTTAGDLNAEVSRTAAELTEATRRLEEGQARLAQLRRQGDDARVAAAGAAARAAASRARLADLVGAAYRDPDPGQLALVLSGGTGLTEALRAQASLEHVQGRQADLVALAVGDRTRAEVLVRQSAELAEAAAQQETRLASELEGLRDRAEQARVRLEAESQRAAQVASGRASRDRSAVAPTYAGAAGPGCGGGNLQGYANGMLPASALCALDGTNGLLLRADAAAAFNRMAAASGMPCAGNSYRSYGQQVSLYRVKPSLAAVPGTSNHGWGVAVDFACGAESFGSPAYRWLQTHGPTYGWTHPSWAEPGGGRPEPWHWEYTG